MRIKAGRLLTIADQAATFLFAIEGALVAAASGLDLFGILVIAFVTALVGGIIRDLLIGFTPPASLRDAWYPTIAFGGAILVFVIHEAVKGIPAGLLLWSDAAGLALFAVVGAAKAIDFKLSPFVAALLGMVSAVGGGVVRDILLNRVPTILQQDIYRSPHLPALRRRLPLCASVPRAPWRWPLGSWCASWSGSSVPGRAGTCRASAHRGVICTSSTRSARRPTPNILIRVQFLNRHPS